MKKRNIILTTATALLLSACIPSVNPFYTDKDVVFEAGLVGEWQQKDKEEDMGIWKFEQGKDKNYDLRVTQKDGKQADFDAHLFKLKQELFLDIEISDLGTNVSDLAAISIIPGHLIIRVAQIAPKLKLASPNYDWLEKYLREHPKALAHHRENDRGVIVLTAETADLQNFVLKHLGEGELFGKPGEMVRRNRKASGSEPAVK